MAAFRGAGLEVSKRSIGLFQIVLFDNQPIPVSVVGGESVIKDDDFSLAAFGEEEPERHTLPAELLLLTFRGLLQYGFAAPCAL